MSLSTYTAGEKLTAASLNLIVSDVNDNTADIATNTADIATNTADIATLNQGNNLTALELTSTFNIPTGAPTNITFGAGTEIVDVSGWHDTSTNTERITPTIEGIYLVTCFVRWNETALNDYGVAIQKNGTTIAETILEGDYYPAGSAVTVVSLNGTTDYVKLVGYTTSGITRQIFRAGLSLMLLRKA